MGHDLVTVKSDELVALVKGEKNGLALPKPFERDILLFETYIAGTTHVENITERISELSENSVVHFFREPDNVADENAVLVQNEKGEKLGYIPKIDNIVFSRLMDAGKKLFGKVKSITTNKSTRFIKIKIEIYLHDV